MGLRQYLPSMRSKSAIFVLERLQSEQSCGHCPSLGEVDELFEQTVNYWHRWLSNCTYAGRWRETVYRSALTLKLLTFEPTGAIIAAPDVQPAGDPRRNPELGLSLHMDPRCGVHPLWLFANRIY